MWVVKVPTLLWEKQKGSSNISCVLSGRWLHNIMDTQIYTDEQTHIGTG